jgi:single-strand DNA-binding protein
MYDTAITICGNVLTAPEWRKTANTGTYVMTFRFASNSRRFDRNANQWVDGDTLRVKVACWRTLGQNAFESITLGDPLVIYGRLYSRDWLDSDNRRRTSYELDAISLGHDLARGVSKFARRRPAGATDVIDDDEAETSIGGEPSAHIDAPRRPAGMPNVNELFGDFDAQRFDAGPASAYDEEREPGDDDDDIDADDAESDIGDDEVSDDLESALSVAA